MRVLTRWGRALGATLLGVGAVTVSDGARPVAAAPIVPQRVPVLPQAPDLAVRRPLGAAWESAGALMEPRWGHVTVTLPDGHLLVIGGVTSLGGAPTPLATCELYDPTARTFTAAGALAEARSAFAAVVLGDGTVLALGGRGIAGALASVERYDPGTGIWSPSGAMLEAREDFAMTTLAGGRVMVAGGTAGAARMGTVEILDAVTGTWTPGPPLLAPRSGSSLAELPDGRLLIAAGLGQDGLPSPGVELADAGLTAWASGPALRFPRHLHAAVAVAGGLTVVGGVGSTGEPVRSAEAFDILRNAWRYEGVAEAVAAASIVVTPRGMGIVTGGSVDGRAETPALASSQALLGLDDPLALYELPMGLPLRRRAHHSATAVADGAVILIGGVDSGQPVAEAERVDTDVQASPCGTDAHCDSGACVENVCCDRDCPGPCQSCTGTRTGAPEGQCGAIPGCPGNACVGDVECGGGWCADGLCCSTRCTGLCDRCNLPGSEGTCVRASGVLNRDDPCLVCAEDGGMERIATPECDPCTACVPYGCEEGRCLVSCDEYTACAWGYTCASTGTCRLPGTAFCTAEGLIMRADGSQASCGSYRCRNAQCPTTCAQDWDCLDGTECQAGACRLPPPEEYPPIEVCDCRTAPFRVPTPPSALGAPLVALALAARRRRSPAASKRAPW